MTRIKICGITTPGDARGAAEAGADALGFVLADSVRRVTLAQARTCSAETPPFLVRVGVLMDAPLDEARAASTAGCFDALQLHGDETPEYCEAVGGRIIKRFNVLEGDTPSRLEERLARYAVAGWLLDPGAGGGRTFDWSAALGIRRPLIVSGGLTPENVGQVVRRLRPYAVDVASGVESSPGRKDMARVRAFIQAVRAADADGVTG